MNKEITVIVNKLSSEVDNFNYAIFEDKHEQLIKEVIEVSEKFAMAFTEWMLTTHLRNADQYTMEELLKIYKEKQPE